MTAAREKTADLTQQAIEALCTVYDPEIPVNVYDLGLIYKIDVTENTDATQNLLVEMTLTTANCPMADRIPSMVYDALRTKIPDLKEIDVRLVWEPPWDPSRMSDDARVALDMY